MIVNWADVIETRFDDLSVSMENCPRAAVDGVGRGRRSSLVTVKSVPPSSLVALGAPGQAQLETGTKPRPRACGHASAESAKPLGQLAPDLPADLPGPLDLHAGDLITIWGL